MPENQEHLGQEINVPTQVIWQEGLNSYSFLCLFCFNQALNVLDDTPLHWRDEERGRQTALLNLLIQVVTSSRNTLTDIPRNNA